MGILDWFRQAATPVPQIEAPRRQTREQTVRLAYDAAARNAQMRDWSVGATSGDSEVYAAGTLIRDRARDLERNSPTASRALRILEVQIMGSGPVSKSDTGNQALDAVVDALWDEFAKQASASNYLDIYGLYRQIARATARDGECLGRFRARRLSDGLDVPLQLELLEADHLDHNRNEELSSGRIVQGVEFDPIGRISAYWLFPRHPGDRDTYYTPSSSSVRVPEQFVFHVFDPLRIGQTRGVSWLSSVLDAIRHLSERRKAERVRARAATNIFGTVQGGDADGINPDDGTESGDEVGTSGYVEDGDGNPVNHLQVGSILNIKDGHTFTLHSPPPAEGYGEAVRIEERTIAAAVGLMYEQLSGDLSQVNWASYRVGDVMARKIIDAWRETVFEPMLLNRIWAAFVDMAIAAGRLPRGRYPARHRWPVHEEMDREAGAKADQAEMRTGRVTYEENLERHGKDLASNTASHERAKDAHEKAGLIFDSQPWQTTTSGQAQSVPGAAAAATEAQAKASALDVREAFSVEEAADVCASHWFRRKLPEHLRAAFRERAAGEQSAPLRLVA